MKKETAQRLALSLSVLSLGFMGSTVILLMRNPQSLTNLETSLADPELRAQVIDELVSQSAGIYASQGAWDTPNRLAR